MFTLRLLHASLLRSAKSVALLQYISQGLPDMWQTNHHWALASVFFLAFCLRFISQYIEQVTGIACALGRPAQPKILPLSPTGERALPTLERSGERLSPTGEKTIKGSFDRGAMAAELWSAFAAAVSAVPDSFTALSRVELAPGGCSRGWRRSAR